jgi:hypothetical protein
VEIDSELVFECSQARSQRFEFTSIFNLNPITDSKLLQEVGEGAKQDVWWRRGEQRLRRARKEGGQKIPIDRRAREPTGPGAEMIRICVSNSASGDWLLALLQQVSDYVTEGQRTLDTDEDQDMEEVSQELVADEDAGESMSQKRSESYALDEEDSIFWYDPSSLR